jgi:hypothetical protein
MSQPIREEIKNRIDELSNEEVAQLKILLEKMRTNPQQILDTDFWDNEIDDEVWNHV